METIAKYPFKFYTRLTLPQLTGIYALNLKELLDGDKITCQRNISDSNNRWRIFFY